MALPRSILLVGRIAGAELACLDSSGCDEAALRRSAYRERPCWLLVGDCPDERILEGLFRSVRPAAMSAKVAAVGAPSDLARFERWVSYGVAVYLASGSPVERIDLALRSAEDLDATIYDRCFLEARQAHESQGASLLGEDCCLSPREREVLNLVKRGLRNADIARELTIALHTVEFHVSNILEKLQARNRTEAAERARALGL